MAAHSSKEVVDGLDEVWTSLLEATEGLGEEEWSLSTECPGWDVADQLSHLIGIERSLMGDAPPEIDSRREKEVDRRENHERLLQPSPNSVKSDAYYQGG